MKAQHIIFFLALYGMQYGLGQNHSGYEKLIKRFHSYVDSAELSGSLIFLEKNGQLKKDIYGYQDIETQTTLTEKSIFRIASMTKPLLATAIMQLVEKGKLSLNEAVESYIPEVAHMRVYDGTPKGREPASTMTIAHLLSHTSGITSGLDPSPAGQAAHAVFQGRPVNNLEELTMLICKTQLAFDPGDGWAYGYSNDLLAFIIEKVEGRSFGEYLKAEVLDPLEMRHTDFQVQQVKRLCSIHAPGPDGKLRVIESNQNSRYINGKNYARGSGGLASTAGDYMHFCQMLLNQGKYKTKRILKPESVQLMMQNIVPAEHLPMKIAGSEMTGQGYGLGLGVVMKQSPFGTEGDVYWPGAVFTYFFVNPKEKTIAIFMTQLYDMDRMNLIWEFHDLATKALMDPGWK